jgi:hypothetical protein
MADLDLEWYSDFTLTPAGDLNLAEGDDQVRQRIERRLFTAVQGYLWHLEYGAGLPQKVGQSWSAWQIAAIVRGQMQLEESVAQSPPPVVTVWADPTIQGGMIIKIEYTDAPSSRQIGLTITV